MKNIEEKLFALQDNVFRDFTARLMPTVDKNTIIGVRFPEIKKMAKDLSQNKYIYDFVAELPHKYYEENALHSYLISYLCKDIEECLENVEKFLPYINNWAICDTCSPKLLGKYPDITREKIKTWIKSDKVFTIRFGVVTLLRFFLDKNFSPDDIELLANIQSDEYYVNISIAWYLSFAIIKQYDTVIKYFENKSFSSWIHNKAIQKCMESYRINNDVKKYLKSLKIAKRETK